ncbi:MAG: YlxM family DNA-binding protein [Oscillospiraceae bacterium]|nr:YlxM family DNA-binding protein [Oscillospiraceae bacterium]
MGDKTLMMTMLLDFYGELLTPRQRSCFMMHYNEDLSLAEIAEIMDISRQGAHDLIARAEATLTQTEEKIGLVKKFSEQKIVKDRMELELRELIRITDGEARSLVEKLISELSSIKD